MEMKQPIFKQDSNLARFILLMESEMRLTKGSLPLLIMSYITSGGPYWRASAAGEYFARLSPQHFAHGHCGTGACRHSTCTACLSKLGVEGGTWNVDGDFCLFASHILRSSVQIL